LKHSTLTCWTDLGYQTKRKIGINTAIFQCRGGGGALKKLKVHLKIFVFFCGFILFCFVLWVFGDIIYLQRAYSASLATGVAVLNAAFSSSLSSAQRAAQTFASSLGPPDASDLARSAALKRKNVVGARLGASGFFLTRDFLTLILILIFVQLH
jgi:hypothetical protein